MRRTVSVVSLALAIGTVPGWAQDHEPAASLGHESSLDMRTVAADTAHERAGPLRRALSALARLRLRPGHDSLDRSAITTTRLR